MGAVPPDIAEGEKQETNDNEGEEEDKEKKIIRLCATNFALELLTNIDGHHF